jgi:hypothetical protein
MRGGPTILTKPATKSASKGRVLRLLIRGFLGYARSYLKNTIKVAIGRQPYFFTKDTFCRLYVRQLLGGAKVHITCNLSDFSGEGGGSQALTMMIVIDFVRALNLTYLHTPFVAIHHADRPIGEWLTAWEKQFNFGAGERQIASCDGDVVVLDSNNLHSVRSLFGVPNPHSEQDSKLVPQFPADVIQEFRGKYYSNKTPHKNSKLTICIHIRRFNSGDSSSAYLASFSRVQRTLSQVQSVLKSHRIPYAVRLFSQGDISEFPDFFRQNAEMFLDADPIWSMQELIEADILIISTGSFGYVAGLLCDGIVLCEHFFAPQSGWLPCADDGEFDSIGFARRLLEISDSAGLVAEPRPERTSGRGCGGAGPSMSRADRGRRGSPSSDCLSGCRFDLFRGAPARQPVAGQFARDRRFLI